MNPSFQGPYGSSEVDNLEEPRRSRQRTSPSRAINIDALRPGESATHVTFMTSTGNHVRFPRALISRHWPQGAIAGQLSDALGYPRIDLPPSRIRRFITPRGFIESRQAAVVSFQLDSLPNQAILVMLPILEHQLYGHFGVPIIVGMSLLRCLRGQEWLLSQNIPDRNSVAAPAGAIHTFIEVIDYPRVGPRYTDWREAMTTDTINNWLANSVRIPE
jgi:hypothetical protein